MRKTLKTIVIGGLALCSMSACTHCETTPSDVSVKTDSVTINDEVGNFSVKADCPIVKTAALTSTINEWLSETMGGTYEGEYKETLPIARHYINSTFKKDSSEYAEMKKDTSFRDDREWKYEYICNAKKTAETTKFVTYEYSCYEYQGGAHGSSFVTGQTFRKNDGRRIGWEVINNSFDDDLQNLIKAGLRKYFNVKNDDELKVFLMLDNMYIIPLPKCPPLFTADGVKFLYGQYEIAPYAAGTPQFTIPYSQLNKFLNVTAKSLTK
jgi:hypothetical protein